jgi:hypothetical protein
VERWPIERLIPYAKNARTHSDRTTDRSCMSKRFEPTDDYRDIRRYERRV